MTRKTNTKTDNTEKENIRTTHTVQPIQSIHTHIQTNIYTYIRAYIHTGKQRNRDIYKHTYTQTDRIIYIHI